MESDDITTRAFWELELPENIEREKRLQEFLIKMKMMPLYKAPDKNRPFLKMDYSFYLNNK